MNRAAILELEELAAQPPRLPSRYDATDHCRECRSLVGTPDMARCALAVLADRQEAGRLVLAAETIAQLAEVPRSPWRVVAAMLRPWKSSRLFYPMVLTGKPGVYALSGGGARNSAEQAEEHLGSILGGYREGWVATYAGAYQVFSR
ncbi:hypothetical protein [Micromonospora sp. NPDC047730]|uniref:hypothetical protein n=1 Tax=Micromonospora sp. NPDC047730 TaxID=3364253 RepID=UPI003720A352